MPNSLTIYPASRPLRGEIALQGDKSLSHRAALFATLAEGESRIANFLIAGVTEPMLNACQTLGIDCSLEGHTLRVLGRGLPQSGGWAQPSEPIRLHCGHSATTMRLLAGFLAALGIPAVLDGSEGLRRRPMRRITEPLKRMGVPIEDTNGRAPLILHRRTAPLHGIFWKMPVASAQVKTAILLAALAADSPTTITEPAPSRDHTERLFAAWGLPISRPRPLTVRLQPPIPPKLPPLRLTLPGDISAAAFLLTAAMIVPGSKVTLRNVLLNPSRTGFLDAARFMGANLIITPRGTAYGEPYGDITAHYSPALQAMSISGEMVVRMVDEFPAFAVLAAAAHGETVVRDAAELRHKESDRITSIVKSLNALEIDAAETPDGFRIRGGAGWRGAVIPAHGDHRIAMAFAVAGLAAQSPVRIEGAEIIAQSFPNFADALRRLGAEVWEG